MQLARGLAAAVCLALALALPPAAGAGPRVLGAAEDQFPSNAIAARPDGGGYLVAWAARTREPPGSELRTVALDAEGRAAGEPRSMHGVDDAPRRPVGSLALAAAGPDRFALVYASYRTDDGVNIQSAVYVRSLDGEGRPLGPPQRIATHRLATFVPSTAIAYDRASRTFLATWHTATQPARIEARRLSRDGELRGRRVRLSRGHSAYAPAVAAAALGEPLLVVWEQNNQLRGRAVGDDGPVGADFEVPLGPLPAGLIPDDAREPALTYDSHRRRFAVAWVNDTAGGSSVVMRWLRAGGRRPDARPLLVSDVARVSEYHSDPSIVFGASDRTLRVGWHHHELSESERKCNVEQLLVRRVRSTGRRSAGVQALSSPDEPGGPAPPDDERGCRRPPPSGLALAARPGRPGYAAVWARSPYLLGLVR